MKASFRHRIKKIGLPPGTLLPTISPIPVTISVLDYDKTSFFEKDNVTAEECLTYLRSPAITWIDVKGTSNIQMIQKIGTHFNLHPLLLEDVVTLEQRPKLDDYKETIYIVIKRLKSDNSDKVGEEQISLILGKDYVISFQESQDNFFEPIKERLRKDNTNMRKMGADYLVYALIDMVVDNYFVILEKIDQNFFKLEEDLISSPKKDTLYKIQSSKRDIILLRKSVWPMREVVKKFQRLDSPLVEDMTKLYMQDVYDHTIQAIDTIESIRDLASSMLEIYLSNINQRLNEIIKFLTIVSTVFAPLTFITGFYGMNFIYMPLLNSIWGLPFTVLIMGILIVGMLYYFRKRKWI